jgi:hypothetical protein
MKDGHRTYGGMRIGRGNLSSHRKPASVPLSSPQISYELTWDQTLATVVGSQQLIVCAVAVEPILRG